MGRAGGCCATSAALTRTIAMLLMIHRCFITDSMVFGAAKATPDVLVIERILLRT
jgi:hypothetical protein